MLDPGASFPPFFSPLRFGFLFSKEESQAHFFSFPSSTHTPLNPQASVAFFDDSTRNVAGAAASGIFSVLVGRTGLSELEAPGASAQLASVLDLPVALPSLWTRHGAEPPADLLRGGRLRSEEEREADGARASGGEGGAAGGRRSRYGTLSL